MSDIVARLALVELEPGAKLFAGTRPSLTVCLVVGQTKAQFC